MVTELEFRLLGPLEGLASGDRVPVPGARSAVCWPCRPGWPSCAGRLGRPVGGILGVAILVAVLGTPDAADVGAAFDRAWAVMAVAGLASALLSLTLGRARGDHRVTRDLATTGAPT